LMMMDTLNRTQRHAMIGIKNRHQRKHSFTVSEKMFPKRAAKDQSLGRVRFIAAPPDPQSEMAQKYELIRLKQAKSLEKQHKSSQNLSDHNQSSLIGKSTARAD